MNILAINPWIYDFAAYDFWLKPYGFLCLLTRLEEKGINIDYLDCLEKEKLKTFGRGSYKQDIIPTPAACGNIPRQYKRYGISPEKLINKISNKKPDYIFITSGMTYWYPAIVDLANILRDEFKRTPIVLGGTYANLCPEHAKKNIACDYVFTNKKLGNLFRFMGVDLEQKSIFTTLPNYDLFYPRLDYVVIKTSWGCPLNCAYCASRCLSPPFLALPPKRVIAFIDKYAKKNIRDFVFYDDALLYGQKHVKEIMRGIVGLGHNLRLHTPNALHFKYLDEELCSLLKKSGFHNPHFGLETIDWEQQKLWGNKVKKDTLIKGVEMLKQAGYGAGDFSVYLLLGYPRQNLEKFKRDAVFLNSLGVKISPAEFSFVPQTKIFQKYKDKFSEPLLQNNSIFGYFEKSKIKEFWKVKNFVKELNRRLRR